ncbi:MAG: tRNA pseudouridine(38-40) synthase TruA [Chloroflexi bacterium]|nr:tRNA pseudouridine(38-40) synthase TruA [Chloroflexota bacterium]
MTRRLRLTVEYDGSGFAGFQLQAKARTVQGELERALAVLNGRPGRIWGAGRTDSGVHAEGQVVACEYVGPLADAELARALNGLLPSDLAVRELETAENGFDPRRKASARTYRYRILNRPARSPLQAEYTWHVPTPLRCDQMNAAAERLRGVHDFRRFASEPGPVIRHLFDCFCHRRGDLLLVDIRASAFARRMVRRIVGGLVNVGSSRWQESEFASLLDVDRASELIPPSAPAHGLTLRSVEYGRRVVSADRIAHEVAGDA